METTALEMGTGDATTKLYSFEYIPLVLILILAVAFAPRMAPWEAYGDRNVQRLTVLCSLLVILVPAGITALLGRAAIGGSDAGPYALAITLATVNVVFLGAALSALIGVVGPLAGPFVWVVMIVVGYQAALKESLSAWLPLGTPLFATTLEARHLAWALAACALSLAVAWFRRGVPLRLAIRPAEEE